MRSLICHFPDEFKQTFVSEGDISAKDVIKFLRPKPVEGMMSEKEKFVWECLMTFLHKASMASIACVCVCVFVSLCVCVCHTVHVCKYVYGHVCAYMCVCKHMNF